MDLAQYRELAAFSQFGSELDKATKDSIEKGKRMMALLNQPQFAPVPVERQVLAIYAVAEGYADDVNVEDISTFESELCSYFAAVYPGLLQQIATGGKMSQELMQQLKDAIAEFKENAA
jgi:F-type H+-transporting ATPase subunit alpha